ncbi:MAG: DUF1571 domain-containing protein [Planctomycetia bacterium]
MAVGGVSDLEQCEDVFRRVQVRRVRSGGKDVRLGSTSPLCESMEGEMIGKKSPDCVRRTVLPAVLVLVSCLSATAEQPGAVAPPQGPGLIPAGDASRMNADAEAAGAAAAGAHPLEPALQLAAKGLASIQTNIKDYSCTMVKRERIDGKLGEHQYMFAKVRQKPFSVYLFFLGPADVKGQEVIYVDGKNDSNMLAHAGSGVRAMVGTVSLKPQSALAMTGNRYPITEFGVENLAKRLVEVAEHDKQFGECEVNFFPNAKVNGRICTCVQVSHPLPRRNFRFHLARVFIDDELLIPIRYEAYDWPHENGGQPVLMEEYTYMNVKTNQGFTDDDFDPKNPSYKFGAK